MSQRIDIDGVLVIGAGLAGLTAALAAAPRPVTVIGAAALGEGCASAWAQGGMAAALGEDDDPALHAADTEAAGAGLCDGAAVEVLTREGPGAVRALAALGAPFDRRQDGGFVQSLEAAHSRPRVARVGGDGAGRAIMQAVIAEARRRDHIDLRESARAIGLIRNAAGRVVGATVEAGGALTDIRAPAVILATGGLGGLFATTTNPIQARGDGLALAALAGAVIVDPEFVQFHPTAIDIGADPAPLATEALRGEGARLIDADGRAFMADHHPAGDLAPRDVVSRAIASEAAKGPVFLDARSAIGADFAAEFPAVFAACMAAGVDPRRQPIPVKPAAHYHMGGVGADLWGATSLEGLWAVGECAASGVHGANRLASNSLLEAVVFGTRAGKAARDAMSARPSGVSAETRLADDLPPDVLSSLRARMSAGAGVVRDAAGLNDLLTWLDTRTAIHGPAAPLVAARLVVQAALERRESRGAHFRADFPTPLAAAAHTRLRMGSDAALARAA